MTSAAPPVTSEAIEQFEEAERALFDRYGVDAETRRLALREPALGVGVVESGHGDPVVFVHGGGSFAGEWAPLLAELPGYRCLAVDRPGSGGTDPFDYTRIDLRRHAVSFLDGVLDALELEGRPSSPTRWAVSGASGSPSTDPSGSRRWPCSALPLCSWARARPCPCGSSECAGSTASSSGCSGRARSRCAASWSSSSARGRRSG